ncbi:MAG: acetoacetate--CoA ligase [Hylemonella sp.]|uniref:acetoacetate--CoA ligase n=1 Tax=Hylemonella sp. TaxID=2066020 RepID=UPI0022C9198D|nr:acetoacetate--CoA ligase [Hylemonella sp.]MCZ8252797.1 acetoacetate--CoA ligase [Hylemonella sp.]
MSHPPYIPQVRLYRDWLRTQRGLDFPDYDALWRWSVTDLDAYWQSIWDCYGVYSPTPHSAVLADNRMPGARWFPGAQLNYAQQVLRHAQPAHAAGFPAIVSHDERSLAAGAPARELAWPELQRQVAALALHLQAQGVGKGDRVVAYLPNVPEAMVAFLAVASLGAIWSICAPDMGTAAVLDRFRQIEPKALIACNGVRYGGRDTDRREAVAELCAALSSVQHLVLLPLLQRPATSVRAGVSVAAWAEAVARDDARTAAFKPLSVPFDHPLWVVYSSGTTGLPKPIVHGHGGILLVALAFTLNTDIGCSYAPNSWGERFHWYSSTGWVMWNCQLGGLLTGTTVCIYDGSPGGATVDAAGNKLAPDWTTLWRFVADTRSTYFGAGAAFFASGMKAGVDLKPCGDLRRVRALGSTGSPLSEEVQRWTNAQMRRVNPHAGGTLKQPGDIWWSNISGGTDFAGAFIAGCRELPQVPGEMQCRVLGCAVEAWNEQGEPVTDAVGELVCTQPIPSMPLYLWNDEGHQRYLASYFDMYPAGHGRRPGGGDTGPEAGPVWRHGDWLRITPQGGCIIYGRSDATINRHGLRMGTSELYSAVEALPEVLDSLVVDLEYLGRESYMPLFVVLRPGHVLDAAMKARISDAIKTALSPRFVPNEILGVAEIPRTLSGKKQELPIKKLLLGQPLEKVVNRDAMANPACLGWYVEFARQYATRGPQH